MTSEKKQDERLAPPAHEPFSLPLPTFEHRLERLDRVIGEDRYFRDDRLDSQIHDWCQVSDSNLRRVNETLEIRDQRVDHITADIESCMSGPDLVDQASQEILRVQPK